MNALRVAICPDDYGAGNAAAPRWRACLEAHGVQVVEVDVRQPDLLRRLRGCHGLMWRHAQYSDHRQIARSLLPAIERALGLEVYPDQATCWHYDDKIAQSYLFEALGIPHPRTWVFFDRDAARRWLGAADYPLVLKLSGGAGSSNVRLVRGPRTARRLLDVLFGGGVCSLLEAELPGPSRRLLRAGAELLAGRGLYSEKYWRRHKNYVLLQEFLPDNAYDTRVTVIGERAFGFRRFNRQGDFRASGSGKLDVTSSAVDLAFVELGFDVARRLGLQSVAIDGLYGRDRQPLVAEISYTYVSSAVHACPGHWSPALEWRAGQLWPEEAQAEDFLARLRARFA